MTIRILKFVTILVAQKVFKCTGTFAGKRLEAMYALINNIRSYSYRQAHFCSILANLLRQHFDACGWGFSKYKCKLLLHAKTSCDNGIDGK